MCRSVAIFGLCLLVCSLSLALPSWGEAETNYPVITSQHKHFPKQAGNIQNAQGSRPGIVSCDLDRPAKHSPGRQKNDSGSNAIRLRKKLSARSAIIMDAATGRTLYSHAPSRAAQPASTIKILTGMLALDSLGDKEWVPVSKRAARMPSSKVYLHSGKSYRANDLINAVLLASANDASVALAEKIAGSEKTFAGLMTQKANELGARNTVCRTATGLTAKGQKSTVKDLAVLFGKAMEKPEFANRMALTKVRTSFGKLLRNHNKALWRVEGTEGGKTGYTRAARQTYVGKFRREEGELLVAILGSETMWDDVARLVEYGFSRKQQLMAGSKTSTVDHRLAMVKKNLLDQYSDGLPVLRERKKNARM